MGYYKKHQINSIFWGSKFTRDVVKLRKKPSQFSLPGWQMLLQLNFVVWLQELSRPHLVELFNNIFSVFKQHYTYFHTLFHSHIFQKNTNNVTNRPPSIWNSKKKLRFCTSAGIGMVNSNRTHDHAYAIQFSSLQNFCFWAPKNFILWLEVAPRPLGTLTSKMPQKP